MKSNKADKSRFSDLRSQADKILKNKEAADNTSMHETDTLKLIHELQVHKIELEMQNDELQRSIRNADELQIAYNKSDEMQNMFSDLYDFSPVGYFTFDEDIDSILMVNLCGAAMLGVDREKLIGKRFAQFITPEFRGAFNDFFKNTIKSDKKQTCEVQILRDDGTSFFGYIEGIVKHVEPSSRKEIRASLIDITSRKLADEQLEKLHNLESLGTLAGGIAHDFNNLLAGILGYISLSKMQLNSENKIYSWLETAENVTMRAKGLTQQLLTFSKGGVPVKKNVPLTKLLRTSVNFALSGSNIKAEFSIPVNIWTLYADDAQISQAISNLVINAIQAMPGGGIIRAGCENTVIQEGNPLSLKQGNYIKITISDTGNGIPEEHLNKIFDPYFSTKEKGRGLGLSICYSIIKNHDGYINVESKHGDGTSFYIYLPAVLDKIEETIEGKKPLFGRGRVLLMDDEKVLIQLVSYMLKTLGYEVEYAGDGAEAIEKYSSAKDSGKPFDAVILDLTIHGGMGGKEAIINLIKINPAVRAIVSSGYSNDPVIANCKNYGFIASLPKPYGVQELSEVLHKVLNS